MRWRCSFRPVYDVPMTAPTLQHGADFALTLSCEDTIGIVHAVTGGEYDKTGLPDPLVLTYYFTVRGDRIVRLIIIRNEPTPTWAQH